MLLDIEVEIELGVLKVYFPDGLVIPYRRKASIYTLLRIINTRELLKPLSITLILFVNTILIFMKAHI